MAYKPTSIMESNKFFFFRGSYELSSYDSTVTKFTKLLGQDMSCAMLNAMVLAMDGRASRVKLELRTM